MERSTFMEFDMDYIVDGALKAIRSAQKFIKNYTSRYPHKAFDPMVLHGKRRKRMVRVDASAETHTEAQLSIRLRNYDFLAYGEESIETGLDLSEEHRLVVLMDMIDGTDLLERGLSNWCSAMVFYYPPERKILASFVARDDDNYIYYARSDRCSPYKRHIRGGGKTVEVRGPSDVRSLSNASIAFYGQKPANFLAVATCPGFISYLERIEKEEQGARIFNLAGNPMMMRLIDGYARIDAVFDLKGQAPHDVVPGAFIAQQAGANLCDIEGRPIDLGLALLKPADEASRLRYLLTSTKDLSHELRQVLTWKEHGS
jgi:fructose-1,6-bisphosphatase/inositol monophosphatase family enzyme